MKLTATADKMNQQLEAADIDDRWRLDTDETSNSVDTWFCANIGGVTDAHTMRTYTTELIESAKRRRAGL